jgi:phosphopantetheinyl transferase
MILAGCKLDGITGREAGRMLLSRLYREATGEELPKIVKLPGGKPVFEHSPWHFSITHTPKHAFCALSMHNIGIDAEEADRKINLKLASRILSAEEKAQFDAAGDKAKALLTFWVLKEAEAKLTGKGIRGFPNQTKFSLEDPRVTETDGCILAVMEETYVI